MVSPDSTAQSQNYSLHANIIYHFTKYVDWPGNKKTGDFVIGIAGDSPLFEELNASVANKKAGDQRIVVKQFSSSAASYDCHILFVSTEESDNIKKIIGKTASTTLVVTESDGLAKKGACINFIIVADKLKLEINKDNIEKRGLGIASELLQLGKIVK